MALDKCDIKFDFLQCLVMFEGILRTEVGCLPRFWEYLALKKKLHPIRSL